MNKQALGRNVAGFKRGVRFISAAKERMSEPVHDLFRPRFQRLGAGARRPYRFGTRPRAAAKTARSGWVQSVAGFGVVGPAGPRSGNSCGISPGSSRGGFGMPGSVTGGGISGVGLPAGSSGGGSVGWPGVAGGISGGSMGITARLCGCRRDQGGGRSRRPRPSSHSLRQCRANPRTRHHRGRS